MTLKEWTELADIHPTHPTTELKAVSILSDEHNPHHTGLWQLDDYRVSSVSGPVVWLVPVRHNMHDAGTVTDDDRHVFTENDLPWNLAPRPEKLDLVSRYDKGAFGWPWVYFHGIEHWIEDHREKEECAPDLVGANIPYAIVPDGIYEVTVYRRPAQLFIWSALDFGGTRGRRTGLVVDPNSKDVKYALKCFKKREACL